MPAQVIALLGSPRPHGNTAILLDEAIRGVEEAGCEVEKVDVPHLDIRPCMEIFHCRSHETCAIEDAMTAFYQKFREVDGLIIAMPVMTMGVPGALKAFMDRFQVFYMAKYERKVSFILPEHRERRKALLISIGGMNIPNDFDGVKLTVHAFCNITDCEYWDEVLQNDMDTIVDIRTRPEVMEEAYVKGRRLGEILQNPD